MNVNSRILAAALTAAALVVPAAALAQDGPSLELGYDYQSRYLFRGLDLLAREPAHVPRVVFGWGGFEAYYYNYSGQIGDPGPDYEEHDFGLDYTFDLDRLSLTVGGLAYTWRKPVSFEDTTEVYAIAGLDAPLSPTLSLYYDLDVIDGGYASLALSHGFDLVPEKLVWTLSGSLGFDFDYNAALTGVDDSSGLNDLLVGSDLAWQVHPRWSVHGLVQRAVALDILDEAGQRDETIVTVGTALTL